MVRPLAVAAVAAVLLSAVPASAHGGMYRGPGPTPVVPTPLGPSTPSGGPGGPGAPGGPGTGPTTGGRYGGSDPVSWQVWWEFNKDAWLQLRSAVRDGAATGSDDYYLGATRTVAVRDAMAPTEKDRRERLVPPLARLLQTERNRDIVTACLVALAKIGLDGDGVVVEDLLAAHLPRDDQEVRETAALSLGIAGRAKAMPLLTALLRDDKAGRALLGGEAVGDRTRAFAAYGLGLLGLRSRDAALRQAIHDALLPVLRDREVRSRDLRVAAVHGLGLLRPRADSAADKRLLWQLLPELWDYYDADLGKGEQFAQAHASIAIARLLGRGTSTEHQRAKQRLLQELAGEGRRSAALQQSAAVALGVLCLPGEEHADDAACTTALLRHHREGTDLQARYFALIALGRIGGARVRGELLALHDKATKAIERPWCALALGILARPAALRGEPDEAIGKRLLDDLLEVQNVDAQAGYAVGLGLSGYADAGPKVLQMLQKKEADEVIAGYLCISLALLGHAPATTHLGELLQRSLRRPFLLQQAAVALGRLGDKQAAVALAAMMKDNDSAAALAAIASALGCIGDRRSIDPLLQLLGDREVTRLGRAFVAAALGGVGDKDLLPWNAVLAADSNYNQAPDTFTNGRTGVLDIL